MTNTHAVGIDLGTTYSCIAYLNEHGEPITISNAEGESSTPSAILIDGDEVVVGTEALRNAIMRPQDVILNAKRYIGNYQKTWTIDGRRISPIEAESMILKKLIGDAQEQIGSINEAVITVPAQFSDQQRHDTIEAGHRAGLQRVDIINEPVAASLCHVLGSEGMWFSELADEQTILVYDLGGGTFDLSLVRYKKDAVEVIASTGDLHLGGIDWNNALMNALADQFTREFGVDPRSDPSSLQALSLEIEQCKRSLSVREKTALTIVHGGSRKSYQVEQAQFEMVTQPLIQKTLNVTKKLLKEQNRGWAHVDAVLTTGGSSRMPMVRGSLKKLSGTTLNTSLSPDQSIAHGATYYAGMLISNNKFARSILGDEARERLKKVKQVSVTARSLGILVRDMKVDKRVPHYLVPANSSLPAEAVHNFGTVVPNQKRVHLQVIESGLTEKDEFARIGHCVIDDLPVDLPEGSEIAVTIRYDEEAKVHVSAKELKSGKQATTEIIRKDSAVNQLEVNHPKEEEAIDLEAAPDDEVIILEDDSEEPITPSKQRPQRKPQHKPPTPQPSAPKVKAPPPIKAISDKLDRADRPVPLCNRCGEPLNSKGTCPSCGSLSEARKQKLLRQKQIQQRKMAAAKKAKAQQQKKPQVRPLPKPNQKAQPKQVQPSGKRPSIKPLASDDDILELPSSSGGGPKLVPRPTKPKPPLKPQPPSRKPKVDDGEDEFWSIVEE
ncbi:Hsp70 family protein [Planctomycetaceae bacterium]|nr:Hsp70 family protein [Planctomycetaceae bacterium]